MNLYGSTGLTKWEMKYESIWIYRDLHLFCAMFYVCCPPHLEHPIAQNNPSQDITPFPASNTPADSYTNGEGRN